MAQYGSDRPLHFRGTPLALSTLLPADVATGGATVEARPVAIPFATSAFTHLPLVSAMEAVSGQVVSTHLPRHTPPGRYEGTALVDGVERPVIYEVEPDMFLRLLPERLVLRVAPGAKLSREITLLNLGNVAVEVRGAYMFGLFDVSGVERAVARTLGEERPDPTGAVDRFVSMLSEEHGGMVRVKVDDGAGILQPGESRVLSLGLALPDRIRPGHTYWGTWPLEYLRYYVRIHVERDDARKEKAR
ncbi:MAG: hypothetical protein ACT4P7_17340 [Gemmatimonadaceae bacterium]